MLQWLRGKQQQHIVIPDKSREPRNPDPWTPIVPPPRKGPRTRMHNLKLIQKMVFILPLSHGSLMLTDSLCAHANEKLRPIQSLSCIINPLSLVLPYPEIILLYPEMRLPYPEIPFPYLMGNRIFVVQGMGMWRFSVQRRGD